MEGIVCIFYGLFITIAFIAALLVRMISKTIEKEEERNCERDNRNKWD